MRARADLHSLKFHVAIVTEPRRRVASFCREYYPVDVATEEFTVCKVEIVRRWNGRSDFSLVPCRNCDTFFFTFDLAISYFAYFHVVR